MRTNQQGDFVGGGYPSHSKLNTVVTAAVFIIVGLLFLGRNFGIIGPGLFDILVSWQMLLIVVGVVNLIKQHFFGGMITIAIGVYFLLPEITGITGEWQNTPDKKALIYTKVIHLILVNVPKILIFAMFRGTIRENLEVPYFVEIASFNSIQGTSNRYKVGCLSAYA